MTCRLSNCCYFNENGAFDRVESQLHGFMLGWATCLHIHELARRSKLIFDNKDRFVAQLRARRLRETILIMSIVFALVKGAFGLVGLFHAPCWIDLDLFATEAKAVFGVGISMYTSSCTLFTAKLYAVLKDASRLRQNRKLKRTERYLYIYSFISPVLYVLVALVGSMAKMDPQHLWQVISTLYLVETLMTLIMCVIVYKRVQDLANQNASVKLVWLTSLCSCGVGVAHFLLNVLVTSEAVYPPEFVWDFSYLTQAYYLYFFLCPFSRALTPPTSASAVDLKSMQSRSAMHSTGDSSAASPSKRMMASQKKKSEMPPKARVAAKSTAQMSSDQAAGQSTHNVLVDMNHKLEADVGD